MNRNSVENSSQVNLFPIFLFRKFETEQIKAEESLNLLEMIVSDGQWETGR